MKIYKLKDEASEGRKGDEGGCNDDGVVSKELKVTDLRQGVKSPNRVNVFLDGKFAFSLDIAQVVEFKLKVGKEVSDEELVEFKKASEFGKLYQRALEKALSRPHSEKEIRDYLRRKLRSSSSDSLRAATSCVCGEQTKSLWSSDELSEFSERIIERLKERGYVDDFKFAEYYAQNRFVKKGVSRKRLRLELMKKGVKKEIIEEVLGKSERNDEEEIMKIIRKKRGRYSEPEKLIVYLCRQGFSYELVREKVEEAWGEEWGGQGLKTG